jgi:molybdopterin molybdotransferase
MIMWRRPYQNCGVNKLFHKVKQKPGKPLYFGRKNNTLVFGLPGNPAAVLTCFYVYVAESLGYFMRKEFFSYTQKKIKHNYIKKGSLTHFVKVLVTDDAVEILDGQESYLVNSFACANALVELPEDKTVWSKGEHVTVLLLWA